MRKIIVLTFITLDGVMQAPGGPKEDTSGNFKFGGWTFPYFDDFSGKVMAEQMKEPFSLLLGRKTFGIFASYWPQHENAWPGVNNATKYVVSNSLKKHMGMVKKNGGKVLGKPIDIPGVGMFIMFKDTEGNRVGMLQPSR